MERRTFETPLGQVWLRADLTAWSGRGPAVVALTGAYSKFGRFDAFQRELPGLDVMVGHLPGNHSPPLISQTVGAFIAAYTSVIAVLDRPVVLCGASVAGTVFCGIAAPNVVSVLALDPLMRSETLARIWPGLREILELRPDQAEFLKSVLGIDAAAHEPREYFHVLDRASAPVTVLAGSQETGDPPSVLSAEDCKRLAAHPRVRLRRLDQVGHDITLGASSVILGELRGLLATCAP